MTDREKLIKLLDNAPPGSDIVDYLLNQGVKLPSAECEIVSPCNVGDSVYKIWTAGPKRVIAEFVITTVVSSIRNEWSIRYTKPAGKVYYHSDISEIGKTLYLTKEEAVQALRKEDEGK